MAISIMHESSRSVNGGAKSSQQRKVKATQSKIQSTREKARDISSPSKTKKPDPPLGKRSPSRRSTKGKGRYKELLAKAIEDDKKGIKRKAINIKEPGFSSLLEEGEHINDDDWQLGAEYKRKLLRQTSSSDESSESSGDEEPTPKAPQAKPKSILKKTTASSKKTVRMMSPITKKPVGRPKKSIPMGEKESLIKLLSESLKNAINAKLLAGKNKPATKKKLKAEVSKSKTTSPKKAVKKAIKTNSTSKSSGETKGRSMNNLKAGKGKGGKSSAKNNSRISTATSSRSSSPIAT